MTRLVAAPAVFFSITFAFAADSKAPRGVLLLLKAFHKSSENGGAETISKIVASCAAIEDTEHLMGLVKPHELSDLSRTDVFTYFEALAAAAERRS